MRRRKVRKGTGVDRLATGGASAPQAWLLLLIFIFQNEFRISDSIQPGYLDFDNLPDTNFTCTGKVIGGYYADLETSCQMFHVCTVGQGDEPMDIKFLCLNGTVFDQETRVCERVDEVDCTKSEKFYSLNLELYGNTPPPAIEPESSSDDDHDQENEPHPSPQSPPAQPDPAPTPANEKPPTSEHHTEQVEPMEDNMEPEEEDQEEEEDEYEEYTDAPAPSTTASPPTTTTMTTPSTTVTTAPTTSSSTQIAPTYGVPSDPSLLSPQEFTFQHSNVQRPPSPAVTPPQAVSFQKQSHPHHAQPARLTLTAHRPISTQHSLRPADQIYITAAPESEREQIDHFEIYESSKNIPRRPHDHSAPFIPQHISRAPQGFRPPTAQPPRSQIQSPNQYERPIQSYQPSERHEILYEDRFRPPAVAAPTYDYDRFHYDRKRSHDDDSQTDSTESEGPIARSVAPPAVTSASDTSGTKLTVKSVIKSPPRVIVTASASVSDSNGKKLNYTVGNVVKAVKPIVAINYDDYKESDLIFDPFFLDVPKLTRLRKDNRNAHDLDKRNAVITLLNAKPRPLIAPPSLPAPTSLAPEVSTAWIPPDYVDDNYEPYAYVEPPPADVSDKVEQMKDNDLKKEIFRGDDSLKEVYKSEVEKVLQVPKADLEMEKADKGFDSKVTSSQSPQTVARRVTDKTTKLVEKHDVSHTGLTKMLARSPALRPLLNSLPPRVDYSVIRVDTISTTRFSCDGKKLYELYPDERECRTFHVCARRSLHVELRCAAGLHFKLQSRQCVPVTRDLLCNLSNV